MKITRRFFLGTVASTAAMSVLPAPSWASGGSNKRFVQIFLRGGLDNLAILPAYGDPNFINIRRGLADPVDQTLELDGFLRLDGRMQSLKAAYDAGSALMFQAVNTPYEGRSHFDAQNVLEIGTREPFALSTGWLGRAASLAAATPEAITLGASTPPTLVGAPTTLTYTPSELDPIEDDLQALLMQSYGQDPLLAQGLVDGLRTADIAERALETLPEEERGGDDPASLAAVAGALLAAEDGPRLASIDIGGWDTHANQREDLGELLPLLDRTIANLQANLGAAWSDTVVTIVTEFGRTVPQNGTNGTDHGTGGMLIAVGGALNGGRVITDWPGVSEADLYDARDLRPTMDTRGILKGLMRDHLGVATVDLNQAVFPDSSDAPAMGGLIL